MLYDKRKSSLADKIRLQAKEKEEALKEVKPLKEKKERGSGRASSKLKGKKYARKKK
jgi:hypothetical protein